MIYPRYYKLAPEKVIRLEPNQIFVFGSNLRGRHGAGAALDAAVYFGAVEGQGSGLQGRSLAVPTKDRYMKPLSSTDVRQSIRASVLDVLQKNHSTELVFSAVGCGFAGHHPEDIAAVFCTEEVWPAYITSRIHLPPVFMRHVCLHLTRRMLHLMNATDMQAFYSMQDAARLYLPA